MKINALVAQIIPVSRALRLSRFFPDARTASVMLILFVFSGSAGAQQPDSLKKLPQVHWARARKIDVQHIALDLRFDWTKKQACGSAVLTLAPLSTTRNIALDAGMLGIQSVTAANGTPLKFVYDGGDKDEGLAITLDRAYAAGETLTIQIAYHTNWVNKIDPNNLWGSFGKGLRFSEPTSNDPNKPREIWSVGDPVGNRYWFPGFDAPNDWRTSEFTATVDKPLQVISNGKCVDIRENTDGTRTFHWKMDTPHANHLTAFVVGPFAVQRQQSGGTALHNYGYPDETEAVAASVERLPDMLRFFAEITGAPYPYPAYSQVFVQDLPGGIENMTFSTITENMVDDYRTHADYLYLWDGQEAQSLAAQWFGNYLTPADWQHSWLSKSFSRYFDCLYNEYKNGHDEFQLWNRVFDQNTYLFDWNAGVRRPIVTPYFDEPETMTRDNYCFSRGALVLHLLRKHLGEENWRKAIQGYVKTSASRPVTTEDFRQAVEAAGGEPMDWFFDQWLYKMGHPVFEVTQCYDETLQRLTLHLKQTQTPDAKDPYPQAAFFQGKMDIEIDDRIETVWVQPQAGQIYVFTVSQQPKLVHFDYGSVWIKEIRFEKTLDELLYQFQHDKDVLGRRWAMEELVKIAKNENTVAADQAKIYARFREAVSGDAYWRWRLNVLQQLQGLLAPARETRPAALDEATLALLTTVIQKDKSWLRTAAINFLGMTRDATFADLYLFYLADESDRVINAAAIALGKSKSPRAFDALSKLVHKPSWKNQSLMSALAGLKELGDPRGFDIAYAALSDLRLHRWRLPNPPVWDLRVFAVETIAALGKSEAVFPLLFERLKQSMQEDDLEGIFSNTVLLSKLADPRGRAVFELLKEKFKDDANARSAVEQYEAAFSELIK